ncbi:MAG: hypothetical protein ACM3SY_01540 [Candidatus Omnitrophota bacterium]
MKVDEPTLQNILKTYGKEMKANKPKAKTSRDETLDPKDESVNALDPEDLNFINYDKEGKIAVNPQTKEALIDFFH